MSHVAMTHDIISLKTRSSRIESTNPTSGEERGKVRGCILPPVVFYLSGLIYYKNTKLELIMIEKTLK